MTTQIRFDLDVDGIATLTWDMPDRSANVFNEASLGDLEAVVSRVASDEAIKGAVFASAKDTFIAGADLQAVRRLAFGPKDPAQLAESTASLGRVLRRMETCGKPFVAAIGGTALGGGFELALACHHRVAADDPRIQLGLPEAQLGLLPGAGGTQRLPRLVGIAAALPLMMEGKGLTPEAARAAGLVHAVVPRAELIQAAKRWILTSPDAVQPWDKKGFKVPGGGMDSPTGRQIMMGGTALYAARTFGNYPAGLAILACVHEGLLTSFDVGLQIENRYFVSLLLDPVSGNMVRTLFLSLQEANKLARRPTGFGPTRVETLGVLGAGLMGAGVAFVAAKAGLRVVLLDRDLDSAERGKSYSAVRLDKEIEKKRATAVEKETVLARITPTADYAELADCDLVVEAVFEDRAIKAAVTEATEAVVGAACVLGSNTSTLPITGLAEASSRPDRFIGIHFFSPVERMPLVEIIRGARTSDATLARTLDFVKQLGKTPIVVNDSRGFYTSRVFGTYVTEGIAMLAEGIAPALIENAGRMTGMPMPPLGLADEVGLGLMHQVGKQTRADLGDAYTPNPSTPVLELLVEREGRLGRKNGHGFYDYTDDGKKRLWAGVGVHFPRAATQPSVAALQRRFMYTQALEAARCMEEGVLLAAEDGDVGAVLGWGFAAYTGGPFAMIDTIGAARFVAECDALADAHGTRFAPPPSLRAMAAEGRRYYPTFSA